MSTNNEPSALDRGLEERVRLLIPTFVKISIETVGFSFSHLLFICDVRIIPTCFISSGLLYFGIATLQMQLNAQGGGEAPWRAALKDPAHYGAGVHRKYCVALLN